MKGKGGPMTDPLPGIHISPHGSDSGLGTSEVPFLTLERARDEIRRQKAAGAFQGARVVLAEGVYERQATFELSVADSGTTEAPVVYTAAPGADVRIIGGRRITGTARPVNATVAARLPAAARAHVVEIDLVSAGIRGFGRLRPRGFCRPYAPAGLEPFFNGKPMQMSAWPKKGHVRIVTVSDPGSAPRRGDMGTRGACFQYAAERPRDWAGRDNLWVHGMFGTVWADDMIAVAALDADNATLTLAGPHLYGVRVEPRVGAWFRFINVLDELSEPGEWYLDREQGLLYFYPPTAGADPEIAVSMLEDPLVAIEGAEHVAFENLTFEISRGMGVYIGGGRGHRLVDCTFRNLGTVAVAMGMGVDGPEGPVHNFTGTPVSRRLGNLDAHQYDNPAWNRQAGCDHAVLHCTIEDTGEGGILLGGGDRRRLEPGGNRVEHCIIRRVNRLTQTYRPAVRVDGVGNVVAFNRMEDLTHSAIIIEGNEHRIEHNRIRNVVTDSDDGGAIYAGRDIAMNGTVIRGNLIAGARGGGLGFRSAIYLDDQVGGIRVQDNILVGNSIAAVISGRHLLVEGNLLLGNDQAIGLDGRQPCDRHLAVWRALGCDQEPWSLRYPETARAPEEHWGKPVGMVARGNVAIGGPAVFFNLGIDETFLVLEGNIGQPPPAGITLRPDDLPVLAPDSPLRALLPELERTLAILAELDTACGRRVPSCDNNSNRG